LSAIIAAVAAQTNIRKSLFANEAKARGFGAGARAGLMLEFMPERIVSRLHEAFGKVSDTFKRAFKL
jgi:hypothetical protein